MSNNSFLRNRISLTTPLLAFAPAFSYILELLGGVLLLVSGTWIVVVVWRHQPASETTSRTGQPSRMGQA